MNVSLEVHVNVSLARRVFLLAYSPERQRLLSRSNLGAALQAAALYDLYEQGLIHDDAGKVKATARRGAAVPDCDLAAELLGRITASERPHRWRHWVKKGDRQATGHVGAGLERERVIRFESHRILGIIPSRRMLLRRPQLRTAATRAMWDAVKPGRPVARVPAADAALAALAYEGELRVVLGGRERRAAKSRIRELEAGLGPVPEALRKVVRDRKSATAGV
ncbi:GOLPH3/VPS74 family protein [Embleya scabrispora]|uniref:GOLPH3/VPS74 family protein n=1 Tax=Embleya scabrispora TaxID=159449 RepID=UPI00037346D4|nr:GPP34 family phosphoprotein [Embleya scabrispora]MYS83662.1 GPP34 family phosphoprotein [Streptomyces sp. SID5474]